METCSPGQHIVSVGRTDTAAAPEPRCEDDDALNHQVCCGDNAARIAAIGCVCDTGCSAPPAQASGNGQVRRKIVAGLWPAFSKDSQRQSCGQGGTSMPCISARSCESLNAEHGEWPTSRFRPFVCGESDAGLNEHEGTTGSCTTSEEGWLQAQATCFEAVRENCPPRPFSSLMRQELTVLCIRRARVSARPQRCLPASAGAVAAATIRTRRSGPRLSARAATSAT